MILLKYKPNHGIIAAGHPKTAEAGTYALRSGGNAIDAAVAAAFMTFVAEPSLTTIAGGGFMMTHEAKNGKTNLFDFFSEMPGRGHKLLRKNRGKSHSKDGGSRASYKKMNETWFDSSDLDFKAINLDFGGALQEFHIGRGSAAVPGNVHGLLTAHTRCGRIPLAELLAPAISAARSGVKIIPIQAFVLKVVSGTVLATAGSRALYAPRGKLLRTGEIFRNPDLASTIEEIVEGGVDFFYRGDFAEKIAREIGEKRGLITREDMAEYRTIVRKPLIIKYRGEQIFTNPSPSMGGRLLAFSLQLLESIKLPASVSWNDPWMMCTLVELMRLTNEARAKYKNFTPQIVSKYRKKFNEQVANISELSNNSKLSGKNVNGHLSLGNTTHLSVLDEDGNAASVTTSHGEGNGVCIRGTGVILNNLLGEEDINPHGFHNWEPGTRLPSMMAPTMVVSNGRPHVVLGSAGSNRLRTAILQTIVRLLDHKMPIGRAVNNSRIHWERDQLDIEPGLPRKTLTALAKTEEQFAHWSQKNLFFGGLHAVMRMPNGKLIGSGDERRGGVVSKA